LKELSALACESNVAPSTSRITLRWPGHLQWTLSASNRALDSLCPSVAPWHSNKGLGGAGDILQGALVLAFGPMFSWFMAACSHCLKTSLNGR
jgi:hypothetical protein